MFQIEGRPHVCKAGCLEPAPDAGNMASDSGSDAAEPIDCSRVGCAPPTPCDEPCTAPCGCCSCAEGEMISRDGGSLICKNGCYAALGDAG